MINVRTIAKPVRFVRKMVGIYGQVVCNSLLSWRKRFNPDKMSVTHFCPGKGRFLRTKVCVFEPGPLTRNFTPGPFYVVPDKLRTQ